VLEAIEAAVGDPATIVFEVHAGAAYQDFGLVEGLRRRDVIERGAIGC
jgi:hypothetical protein